jgi:plastocyanin
VLSRIAISLALVVANLGVAAQAATVHGTLPTPSIVWISDDSHPVPGTVEYTMSNTQKTFVPGLIVIPAGAAIRFPNEDPFFHSIYSDSPTDPFDIGFYDTGPGKLVTFANPGVVNVRCHIHGSMHATIIVVDGPWAQTDHDGQSYDLLGVRPGRHTLHVWTPDGGEKTSIVKV